MIIKILTDDTGQLIMDFCRPDSIIECKPYSKLNYSFIANVLQLIVPTLCCKTKMSFPPLKY